MSEEIKEDPIIDPCLNNKCGSYDTEQFNNCALYSEFMLKCCVYQPEPKEIKTCDNCGILDNRECFECKWNQRELMDHHVPLKEEYYNFSISVKEAEESSLMLNIFNIPPISMKEALENLQKPSTRETTMTIEIEKREKK